MESRSGSGGFAFEERETKRHQKDAKILPQNFRRVTCFLCVPLSYVYFCCQKVFLDCDVPAFKEEN